MADDGRRPAGSGTVARAPRVVFVLDQPGGKLGRFRMGAPDRVLRLWSLLNAAADEFHHVGVAPGSVSRLQRLVEAVAAELERSVTPALAGKLRHLMRPGQVPVSAAELRIEYVSLLGWMSGLGTEILGQLEAARDRLRRDSRETGMPGEDGRQRAAPAHPRDAETSCLRDVGRLAG